MRSVGFTLLEFITIEQYITYINFFHTSGIGRMIKILLDKAVKDDLLSVVFLAM